MSSPQERFAALFDRTHQPLLAYAVRRVADPADAADVVAETFLVAWRRLDEVPAGDDARPWLFGVARNVLANHYRGERRRLALADRLRQELPHVAPAPEVSDPGLAEAMRRLPEDDREVLRLVAWEDLARDEIAVALGVSRAMVRVRLHRARKRLLRELAAVEHIGFSGPQRESRAGHVVAGWADARPGLEEIR
ncbi:RNA polymerase sigma-70 factor (ECF subfamily) [Kineococcus xinjiangensis]|uniref:RNA polymerase sigma-70 factor (ECF subfamily) n=1 Tax=Kineococcus xinjiangensis TaxID=512762 RepID=A0A2S6IU65_9ACTN|nr:RNA polymerase sigma factor [Kineococcus xinjiangensis]PPK97797.1 RNA polymerase sigma-70 factor (ECF subfamily) [Kineococcus xinjiangensis]